LTCTESAEDPILILLRRDHNSRFGIR
jgi:hypothetical protein